MKCPLYQLWRTAVLGGDEIFPGDCLQEECAWWDEDMSQCSINGLEGVLEHIALSLKDIREIMPHVRQDLL